MNANSILLQKKYTRIIAAFAKENKLSFDDALYFFYHSTIYKLLREGISDLHCMSDLYLTEELSTEYTQDKNQ